MSWINTPHLTPTQWKALELVQMWVRLPKPFDPDAGGYPFTDAPNRTHYRFVMAAMLRHAPFQIGGAMRTVCGLAADILTREPPGVFFDWVAAQQAVESTPDGHPRGLGGCLIQWPIPSKLRDLWQWVRDGAPESIGAADIHAYTDRVPDLFRQIAGYPWRPHLSQRWRTADVLALASSVWAGAWDQTPILADALQDAGCDREDVLSHLRAAGIDRTDGDWAVADVLLPPPDGA